MHRQIYGGLFLRGRGYWESYPLAWRGNPSSAWVVLGPWSTPRKWSGLWTFWFNIQRHCGSACQVRWVGSLFYFSLVFAGRLVMPQFPVACIMDRTRRWVGAHEGIWRPGENLCMSAPSLKLQVYYYCYNVIKQIDNCYPRWRLLVNMQWCLWKSVAADLWYWRR